MTKLNTQPILCAYGTRGYYHSFAGLLVILKNAVNWIYGVIGIFIFALTIMLGFKFYKRIREKVISI
jgi:hypothetical protein